MRKIFILVVLVACVGCVAYRPQKPSTTLLPPIETDLRKFYDENIDGIMCLSEFLSPQRLVIGIKDFDPIDNGIRVKQIGKNSPAENAGLKVGDIITKVNGKSITHPIRKSQGQIFIVHNFVLAKEGISKTSGQSLHIAQPLIFCKDIFY